jgi:hypothetical protein
MWQEPSSSLAQGEDYLLLFLFLFRVFWEFNRRHDHCRYTDAYYTAARFNVPMGLAFLERTLDAGRVLLIADSGNGLIRALDTTTRIVTTWFAPMDTGSNRELNTPVGLAVSTQGGTTMVYVADSGKRQISVIQQPSSALAALAAAAADVKVLTAVRVSTATNTHFAAVVPYGMIVTSSATVVGYTQLLTLDSVSREMSALVQDMLANSIEGGGSVETCHLPCQSAGCGPLSSSELCGNSFLDAGESCDAPVSGSGCYANNCTLQSGFTCPLLIATPGAHPPLACLDPCPGHVYAPTGVAYCADDCAGLTPRAGYTIDAQCVETDIDECATNGDTCDASAGMCVNTAGSYRCQCFSGYFGDGTTCIASAYAVYTVVDIPSLTASVLNTPDSITAALMATVEEAYASALSSAIPSGMMTSSLNFALSAGQLATLYTSYSVDPARPAKARIELVSLFETSAMATAVANGIAPAQLSAALSVALFGVATGATVFQRPMVRSHQAAGGFGSTTFVDGWGMNVTGVTYNRTCSVLGVDGETVLPLGGGCWQVEMVYMGGRALPSSNENPNGIQQQSKNVLYLPRIERDPNTLAAQVPAQMLTMSTGAYFPCDVSNFYGQVGLPAEATACCLRQVEAGYRTHTGFAEFLGGSAYAQGVPVDACSGSTINDTYPSSDIVFTLPESLNNDATNDLVVGRIEGMPHSEVRLLETIDYTTRTFRVLLVLEEVLKFYLFFCFVFISLITQYKKNRVIYGRTHRWWTASRG